MTDLAIIADAVAEAVHQLRIAEAHAEAMPSAHLRREIKSALWRVEDVAAIVAERQKEDAQ
jgi:hypothetical protein